MGENNKSKNKIIIICIVVVISLAIIGLGLSIYWNSKINLKIKIMNKQVRNMTLNQIEIYKMKL